MVVRQNSDKVIVLEDTVTFPSAMIFGIALALIAILMFVSFPLFSEPPFSYWFSTLFIFGDAFFIFSARKVMITLDKEANTMVVSKFSIIGKRTSSLSLDSISAVALGKEGQMHLLHIPVFKFFFKDSRTFTYDYLVDELFEASVIATFIGVPLVPDETDIRQLLATKTG